MSFRTKAAGVALGAAMALSAVSANAGVIQLGFILDDSGSIGAGNWNTIRTGLANAVNTLIPVGGTDTYEISVVRFSTTAVIDINGFLVSDAAARTALAGQIAALPFAGGNTNFAAAFSAMQTAMTDGIGVTASNALFSYVNFATDGQQNVGGTGVAERNALIAAGIDNISIEGIGVGVDANDLRNNFCYPGPCDTTAPFDFPAQGFYIGVADAAAYAAAIGNKIQIVTGQVPEPASLALLGVGLIGLGAARRRLVG